MIYLAIDTDVWLHLATVGYDKEHNLFDELCFWLELGEVGLIIPDHILAEWERNKESKIAKIKTFIATSVGQLKNLPVLQDRKLLQSVFNSDNFEASARARVAKIDEILSKHVLVAPLTENAQHIASYRTLHRLAPSHEKDSFSDAVNIFSVIDHIRDKAITPVIFVTNNYHDYSDTSDRNSVHPDLKQQFEGVGLAYAPEVAELFHKTLRPQLSSFSAHLSQKKAQEQIELLDEARKDRALLANTDEDFIINSAMLEHILNQPRPSHFQEKFVRELIDSDEHCRKYFFDKVDKPGWLPFMDAEGYLEPNNHPGPKETPNGLMVAHWESLGFLLRLSEQVKEGKYPELTESLIKYIERISDANIDNDMTNSAMIRMLGNLPNEAITIEMLERLPLWFSPNTNKMFPSSAIVDRLLPKFLGDGATPNDVPKAEKIISYLLGISRNGVEIDDTAEKTETSFFPNASPWEIAEKFVRKDMIKLIAEQCDPGIFLEFARTVKLLVLDYPNGLHMPIKKGELEVEVKIKVDLPRLKLTAFLPDNTNEFASTVIENFDALSAPELKGAVASALTTLGLPNEPKPENERFFTGLIYALTVDRLSVAGSSNLSELNLDRSHSKHFRESYTILLISYLAAITESKPAEGIKLSEALLFDPEFKLPIFKRVVLHNISKHFDSQRSLFTRLLGPDDPQGIFDAYVYRPELYNLLQGVQTFLNEDEITLLSKIIQAGPRDREAIEEERIENWRFRWCLALNQIEPFATRYKEIGAALQLKDSDGDPNQRLRFRSGTVPPINVTDFLALDDADLINYLLTFNPKDRWEEPNVEGLAETFKNAVAENPNRFMGMLENLLALPYIYAYHLLYAFLDIGRKNPADMDWTAVLSFCKKYVEQSDFVSEHRKLASDGWRADQHWVMGVISYLVSDVCRKDDVVTANQLLPICESILLTLNQHGVIAKPEEPRERDYIFHSYNSDNGKFLRASMDYSLCKNRILHQENPVFDQAFKTIFDHYLQEGSVDAWSIVGYYWQQFNYLDRDWLTSLLENLGKIDELSWGAFMGSFIFAHAPGIDELLKMMEPQYRRAIAEKMEIKVSGTNGFAGQLASLYLWDKIDLSGNSLFTAYLKEMPVSAVAALLHVIFFSESFFESLDEQEYLAAEQKIIDLIEFLHAQFSQNQHPEIVEMRRSTVNIIHMIRGLNDANTNAIGTAIALASKQYHQDDLFEPLHELVQKGEPALAAKHLAAIMDQMTFQEHMHLLPDDLGHATELIQFLYDHDQKPIADKLCNRLTKAGQYFAKEIYNLNNVN